MAENPFDTGAYQPYTVGLSAQWTPRPVPPPPTSPGWSGGGSFTQPLNQPIPQAQAFHLQPNWSSPLSAYGQVGNPGALPPGFMINPALRAPPPILQAMGAVNPGIPIINPFAASIANYAGAPNFGAPLFGGAGRPLADPAWGRLQAPYQAPTQVNANTSAMEQELRRWMRDTAETLHSISSTDKRLLWLSENPVGVPPGGPRMYNAFGGASVPPSIPPPPPPSGPWGPIGGGGAGGGGQGGGGAGGGGYNNWAQGFRGIGNMLGIGRFTYGATQLGGALWGAPGAAYLGGGAAIAELLYKGARLPLEMGNLEAGIFGESRPYTDYMVQLANASRAAGADFRGIGQQWIPNWGQSTPGWKELGITPQRALESISRMGGMRPGMDTNDFILQARNLRLSPAYSMLPEGSVEALGQQGLKYGIAGTQNPLALAEQFAGTLETAFARGADRAEVFKQIQTATEVVARSSVYSPNTQGIADFMQRMFQVDMPGARSGIMGQNLITGTAQALDTPFANSARTFALAQLQRSINWNDPKAVSQLLGSSVVNSDYGKQVIQMMQGPMGHSAFGIKALSGLLEGNPTEVIRRITQMPNQFGTGATAEVMRDQWLAGVLGRKPEEIGAYRETLRRQAEPTSWTNAWDKWQLHAGATSPAAGSTPKDIYAADAEQAVRQLAGMREYFETFGKRIDLINTSMGHLIDSSDKAAQALLGLTQSVINNTTGGGRSLTGMGMGAGTGALLGSRLGPLGTVFGALTGAHIGAGGSLSDIFSWQHLRDTLIPDFSGIFGGFSNLNPISPAHAAEANTPQFQAYVARASYAGDALARSIAGNRYTGGAAGGGVTGPRGAIPYISAGPGSRIDPRGMEPIIRAAAIRHGVDPDIAMRVAASEGLGNYVGDHGTSFGAFQLHTGGGLGDQFRKETGLDPADPKNEAAMIDFTMRTVHQTGWSPYHGSVGAGVGSRQGIGAEPALGVSGTGSTGAAKAVDDMMRLVGADQSDPRVRQWIQQNGGNIDPRTAAWCAAFLGSSFTHEGVGGGKGNIATSWETFGHSVSASDVQKGDVLVIPRGLGPGQTGGHVGAATGAIRASDGFIQMIQGNRSHRVALSWEDPRSLMIRRADGSSNVSAGDSGSPVAAGSAIDLHSTFEHLASIAKEVAQHLHDLGHGARNATSGIGTKQNSGPNPKIAMGSTGVHASTAYP